MILLEQMNRDLGIDKQYILNCSKRNDLYAKYYIQKKNGGYRKILHPSKELKTLQYWLVRNIFSKFKISKYSTAYQKGCSIKKNAEYHKDGKYILHTDIVHFFESITRDSLLSFFDRNRDIIRELQLSENDIEIILDLVLYNGLYLVVGSVASPIISNCIMYDFDIRMSELAKKMNMKYSRYADDIVVSSSDYIDKSILGKIDELLEEYNLKRNVEKTYFMCRSGRREITGIVVDNNKNTLSIGHKRYNQIKRDVYNLLIKDQGNISQIKGMLGHLKNVNCDQYNAIRKTYIKYDKNNELFKESKKN